MDMKPAGRVWMCVLILAMSVGVAAGTACAATMYDDAIHYWAFDGDASDSGDAGAGVLTSGTLYGNAAYSSDGLVGGAISLDGSGDYVKFGDGTSDIFSPITDNYNAPQDRNQPGTNDFTFSVWIKPAQLPANFPNESPNDPYPYDQMYTTFFQKGSGPTPTIFHMWYQPYWNPQGPIFGRAGDSWNANLIHSDDYSYAEFWDGEWHQVVYTHDSTWYADGPHWTIANQFFVDGELVMSSSSEWAGDELYVSNAPVTIGATNSETEFFKGLIDEVAVWDYAMLEGDVNAMSKTGYVSDAINGWTLGYDTDEVNLLMQLFADGENGLDPDPVTIDGIIWTYYDGTLPGYTDEDIGEAYVYDGGMYIVLGSGLGGTGLGGEGGGTVPEPATAVMLLAGGIMGAVKAKRKK